MAGHYTTYECAVRGYGDISSLQKIRTKIKEKINPPSLSHYGPKLVRKTGFCFEDRIKKYIFPFMGADATVVRCSQRSLSILYNDMIWPQYAAYGTLNSWNSMALMAIYGGIFQTLAKFDF